MGEQPLENMGFVLKGSGYFFDQRTLAALRAIWARRSGDKALALLLPPFNPPMRPRAMAAASLPESADSSARSPVEISTISFASWLVSRGLRGARVMRPFYL